ncbi:FtsX-like permease family protein [Gemmatimonas sp.]|uniref:ABC transporter permease n=1 Tax=Gemmatimonas sp. TaxID=1962908 RepID=UPI00333E8B08
MIRWLPFEAVTAVRFLREGRMQTAAILSGVGIGVGVIVFMSAMLTSLQGNFITRVLMSSAHIQILPPDAVTRPLWRDSSGVLYARVVQPSTQRRRSIDQWQTLLTQLRARTDIAVVTPTVSAAALAVHGNVSRSIALSGIEPEAFFRIVKVPQYVTSGDTALTGDGVLLGTELARDLGVAVGDQINVLAASAIPRALTVSGIFDLGNKGANQRSTYVTLRTAQALADLEGGVTSIDMTVTDLYAARTVADAVSASTGVQAESWMTTNAQLFSTLSAQEMSFTTIEVFVGLSVAFGVASVLIVSVIQRSADIGILRAMGATQGQILRVFLVQGSLLGGIGSMIGSVLGVGALWCFHVLVRLQDGSALFPLMVMPSMFGWAVSMATVTGFVAAALPALKAARLDPVDAIHG